MPCSCVYFRVKRMNNCVLVVADEHLNSVSNANASLTVQFNTPREHLMPCSLAVLRTDCRSTFLSWFSLDN